MVCNFAYLCKESALSLIDLLYCCSSLYFMDFCSDLYYFLFPTAFELH